MAQKRIFISYRRSDAGGHAGRLYDYLKEYFGAQRIFFDVDTIAVGTNFEQKINSELDNSDAVLVLIGNQWLDIRDKDGNRRLDDPGDYVRLEVATALGKNVVVIPILLQGAQMPSKSALPENLCDLSFRNAIRLNDDHWYSDCNLLAGVLKNALHTSRSLKEQKIRRYTTIVLVLVVLASLASILNFLFFSSEPTLMGIVVKVLSIGTSLVNIALVTYLLGSIKKDLDRLSWVIIWMAILSAVLGALGGSLTAWLPMTMILVAGLLNFVEADE